MSMRVWCWKTRVKCSHDASLRDINDLVVREIDVEVRRRRWWIALALACVALAYFSAFRGYGINLPDEGTLLYKFERMADGQRLYADFHAGYTPGVFYVHSFLQEYLGQSILPGRVVLALVNSMSVAMLFLLAAPLCGNGFAAVAALLYPAFMPVHPGHFASFNVPYPTWYSVAIFLAGLLAARGFVERPRNGQALLVGLLAGLGFLFKPNIGAFQLACGMLLVLSALPRVGVVGKLWWWLVWAAVLAGMLAVFGGWPGLLEIGVFLVPAFAAGALAVVRSDSLAERIGAGGARGAGVVVLPTVFVGAAFVAVTLAWLGYYARFVPLAQLLEEALFIGSDYASFFYVAHPRVFAHAGTIAAGLLALRAAPAWIARRGRTPSQVALGAMVVLGVLGVTLLSGRPMLHGFVASMMSEIETAWSFAAAQAAIALAIAFALRGQPVDASAITLAIGAPLLYLGNFPRTDFMHWLWAAPVAVAAGVAILASLAREWSRGSGRLAAGLVTCALTVPLLLVGGLRIATSLRAIYALEGVVPASRASVALGIHRAPVWMNIGRAESYRDLEAVAATIREIAEPGQKVFTFPALDAISYLSDRDSPLRDSYFIPGWIGRDDEARAVAAMRKDPPPYVVVLRDDWTYFEEAPRYYASLRAFIESEYRSYVELGRYAILAHRSIVEPPPRAGIGRGAADPRVERYLTERLQAASAADLADRVERLRYDAIEGYYPMLTELLRHEDVAVRAAAVSALRFAADDRAAVALFEAAVAVGRLPERERLLALRLAGAWAGEETAARMREYVEDVDTAVAVAARIGIERAAQAAERRDFWFEPVKPQ